MLIDRVVGIVALPHLHDHEVGSSPWEKCENRKIPLDCNSFLMEFDIISHILGLSEDYGLLYHCSLVNWEFNRAASQMLYLHVVLSPPFRPMLDLRDTGLIPVSENARYVSGKRFLCH